MSIPEKQKKYNAANIKRVPLDLQKKDYEVVKSEADKHGEKVNYYIKSAIWQRLENDGVDISRMKSDLTQNPDNG